MEERKERKEANGGRGSSLMQSDDWSQFVFVIKHILNRHTCNRWASATDVHGSGHGTLLGYGLKALLP